MPDTQVDAALATDETPQTPPQVREAQEALDKAQDAVVDEKERIRDLESKLTREGRSKAQIKAEADEARRQLVAMQSQVEAAKAVNERWQAWYLENQASPAEKDAAVRQRMSREQQEAQKAKSEAVMLRAILKEEDPAVKRILSSLADDGRFLDAKEIEALKRGLATGTPPPTQEEDEEEEPPKVKPKRSSNATPNLDQQIKDAKERRDSVTLLNLLAEKQSLDKRVGA